MKLPPTSNSSLHGDGQVQTPVPPRKRLAEGWIPAVEKWIGDNPVVSAALAVSVGVLAAWWIKRK